ncbi:MAG: DUF4625 domain-containing protein [Pyrinomonadaceae bacterium]|nr:DUF4625 domain-containing protein [Pyrinomonadaceae bacterium]
MTDTIKKLLIGSYLVILLLICLWTVSALMTATVGENAIVSKTQQTDTGSATNTNTNISGVSNTNMSNANTKEALKSKSAIGMTIASTVKINLWFIEREITGESYLFLVVLFTGCLGAIIRSIYSFFTHLGQQDFAFSWLAFYLLSPISGGALSIVFYFVIRGGFYNPVNNGELSLNLFSFAALSSLVGLFSENAMRKLKQISETLFTNVDSKSDAKQIPQITLLNLPKPEITAGENLEIQFAVTNGKTPYKYKIDFEPDVISPIEGDSDLELIKQSVTIPNTATSGEYSYLIEVSDANGKTNKTPKEQAKKFVVKPSP